MRHESDKPARGGQGWLHFFESAQAQARAPVAQLQPRAQLATPAIVERAYVECRHVVYTALLSSLSLWPEHKAELMRRGLPSEEIQRLQYASAPTDADSSNLARSLSQQYGLTGVPGFYQLGGEWRIVRAGAGFFVPYRNERGLIEGLQLRRFPYSDRDKYLWLSSKGKPAGASSGSPLHFAKSHLLASADEVVITEGALKADVAAYLSGAPVIAAAGVSNFGDRFAERLRTSFPNLRRTVIAFDRDILEKSQVSRALLHLSQQLEQARFMVRVRTWPPPAKGYDDYLLSQVTIGRGQQ
jgi:hypothetical protein